MMQKNVLLGAAFVLVFALGGVVMKAYIEQKEDQVFPDDSLYDEFFDDDFFARSKSPFEEMDRMQRRMDKLFERHDRMPSFDQWFGRNYGEFPAGKIHLEENDDSLAYVLDVEDSKVVNVDVSTESGYVSIKAELKQQTETMQSTRSISQRFPMPANVDPDSVTVEQKGDKIYIRFDKKVI